MLVSYFLNIILIVLVLRARTSRSEEDVALSYSAAIATGVVTAPLAEEYHFVLYLPLVIGLLSHFMRERVQNRKLGIVETILIIAVIVMALPINYKVLNFQTVPMIFLAYPKLYAGIALLFCFVSIMRKSRLSVDNTLR